MNFGLFLREENVSSVAIFDSEKRILAVTKSASSHDTSVAQTAIAADTSPSSTAMSSSAMMLEKSTSVSASSNELSEKRNKSAGTLKLKLSTMMNFLNAQLELVEDLEREEKSNSESAKAYQLREQIKSITESELETVISFRNKWKEFV